jgi:arylsulfatase A-like enzyme/Tfp pilus assembly protein PilF
VETSSIRHWLELDADSDPEMNSIFSLHAGALMRRRMVLFGIAAGVFAGLAVWLWPRPRPNLLVITLDTTRADRLGCYGYADGQTPVLDALASSGVLCERAYTVAPLTLPAHTSLFTGLLPPETGVRRNGHGRLSGAIPTLAEVLKRQGYDTAAFVASFVLDGKFGLDRGFETYDDEIAGNDLHGDAMHRQRPGAAVVDAALQWLAESRSRPFFCWVHLYDPHFPYLAHRELFGDGFADRPYDAEIAYVDRQVGRLVDFLKLRRLDDQTLVVVVGDHGEGLGDHFEKLHGSTLYDSTMHVPLIFRHPARLPSGGRVATNVSMVDVSPTILDLLSLPALRSISGKSVLPALRGGAIPASSCYGATDEPLVINGWSPLRSLTDGDLKYIRTTREELYDLASDPHEQHNLADADPGRTQEMASRLAGFESRLTPRAESSVQLSAADRRALTSLGYVAGRADAAKGPARSNLPDVKDMLPFDVAVEDAEKLFHEGAIESALEKVRPVVAHAPTFTKANWVLAWALWEQSKKDEAMDVFRALLTLEPDCLNGHYGLALMLAQGEHPGEAIPEFLKALKIDPDLAGAHYHLAKLLLSAGRVEEALSHFNATVKSDPRHAEAFQWRALLLARRGQIDEAIADYRKALQFAPDSPETHHNFGMVLAERGEAGEARQNLARAVELNPQSAEMQYDLGVFLARRSRPDEAIVHLEKALELKPDYTRAEEALQAVRQTLAARHPEPK